MNEKSGEDAAGGTGEEPPEGDLAGDYGRVSRFLQLRGRRRRPVDSEAQPRSDAAFRRVRSLLPRDFFEPFNAVRSLLGLEPLHVAPRFLARWNRPDQARAMALAAVKGLEEGRSCLVPALVRLHENLNWERRPARRVLERLQAIVVPGSRNFERVAEAHRFFKRTSGRAVLVTHGCAPSYDRDNSGLGITEAEAYRSYWRALGVPDDRIIAEGESHTTAENVVSLRQTFSRLAGANGGNAGPVLLVSSHYHLARFRLNARLALAPLLGPGNIYAAGAGTDGPQSAQLYFLNDPKAFIDRQSSLTMVFDEYLKIAFDLCSENLPWQS